MRTEPPPRDTLRVRITRTPFSTKVSHILFSPFPPVQINCRFKVHPFLKQRLTTEDGFTLAKAGGGS